MNEIVPAIAIFGSLFGIIYIYLMTRNRERMALIEKGASAELFNKPTKSTEWVLKLGIVSISVGIGIIVANLLVSADLLEEDIAFSSIIFIFAGIGLMIGYYLAGKKKEDGK